MNKLQVLMPMAGLGSRFAKAGFATPKPLIEVDGMPMFRKALTSLNDVAAKKSYYFVIRQQHVDEYQLDTLITHALPEANVVIIPELTRGAAETALAAKSKLTSEDALIIMDCDLWFQSTSYKKMVNESIASKTNIAGGLLTFESDNPRYSYALLDEHHRVVQTAEKRVISSHAITGAYFFSRAKHFTIAAEDLLQQPLTQDMPEYYLSLLYNILIRKQHNVAAAFVDEFASFGTPEELATYQKAMHA